MATTIPLGTDSYFTLFADGQSVDNAVNYFSYAPDLDTNFKILRLTINTIVNELKAISGPNAVFGNDIMFLDDATITTPTTTGRIGINNIVLSVNADPKLLDMTGGTMSLNSVRTDVPVSQQLSSVGFSNETVNIAMDVNGIISLASDPLTQVIDIGTVIISGVSPLGEFGTLTDNLQNFIDGDAWFQLRDPVYTVPTGITFSPLPDTTQALIGQYAQPSERIDSLETLISGFTTNTRGDTLGPIALSPGTEALPSLVFQDGTGTIIDSTGLYREAGTDLAVTSDGNRVAIFRDSSGDPQLAVELGVQSVPGLGFTGDANSGLYGFTGTPSTYVALVKDGNSAIVFDQSRFVHFPKNARVKGNISGSQTFADATPAEVGFDGVDSFDINFWHDSTGISFPDTDFIVPARSTVVTTGSQEFDTPVLAVYLMVFNFEFAESITRARDILIEIRLNGSSTIAESHTITEITEDYSGSLSAMQELDDADVVSVQITQTESVDNLGLDLTAASFTIVKQS